MNNKKAIAIPFVLLAGALAAGPAHAAGWMGTTLEQMTWKEYAPSGPQLLKETVPRFGVGAGFDGRLRGDLGFALYGRVYAGRGDYDGALQNGTPYSTKVNYGGYLGEAGLNYAFNFANGGRLTVGSSLGLDQWRRDISGQIEDYDVTYLRTGVSYAQGGWKLAGGIKTVLHVHEDAHLDVWYTSNPTLHPKSDNMLYLEAGRSIGHGYDLSLYADGYRFRQSDSVGITDGNGTQYVAYQPKVRQDTLGLRLGHRF